MKKYKQYKFHFCNSTDPKNVDTIVEYDKVFYYVTNDGKSIAPDAYYFLRFMPLIDEVKDLSDEYCENAIKLINDKNLEVIHDYINKKHYTE